MATTNNLRKGLNRKTWEFCNPVLNSTSTGSFIVTARDKDQLQLYVQSGSSYQIYYPTEDSWATISGGSWGGSFGAGSCGVAGSWSTGSTVGVSFLTATAGSTTTITTNQPLARDLRGYKVQFLTGTNAGTVKTIASNTVGTNAIITFTAAEAVPYDNTSTYRLLTPVFYLLNAGTTGATSFKKLDIATNTVSFLVQTGLPATIGTDSRLISTPSFLNNEFVSFSTGTASAGGASTLTDGTKSWATNQWTNYQIRITGGTGAGQIRMVASNTGTVITTSAGWTTVPDVTSTYSIEGNDDYLYYMGSGVVTLYRYSIQTNTWSTLTPGVARGGAPGAGMSGHWVHDVNEAPWNTESAIINGRRIYSFRGGNTTALDYYDIPSNQWASVTYALGSYTFLAGMKYAHKGEYLYIHVVSTGIWLRYSFLRTVLEPWSQFLYPQTTSFVGDTSFLYTYKDGATEINWVYMVLQNTNVMLRCMII